VKEGTDPGEENDWSLLPFLALPDGSHMLVELMRSMHMFPKLIRPLQLLGRVLLLHPRPEDGHASIPLRHSLYTSARCLTVDQQTRRCHA